MSELTPVERIGRWFTWIRLGAVPVAAVYIVARRPDLSPGYETAAWVAWVILAAQAVAVLVARRRPADEEQRRRVDAAAIALDLAAVATFTLAFSADEGQPLRSLAFLVVVEAALRFGVRGGIVVAAAFLPVTLAGELVRHEAFGFRFNLEAILLRPARLFVIGAVVGRLTADLGREEAVARTRAGEAERLRDELGRRVDLLEAANRCARALGSSLELDQAFTAFIRELQGLVPFDRTAVVLAEDESAQVMATAGLGAGEVFPPGTSRPAAGSVLAEVLEGRTLHREDLRERRFPEDEALLALGIHSEVVAPLLLGPRAIGMLAVGRSSPGAFSRDEVELLTLLGRLVATAVQNIRAYEAERHTVEELRRLSELRADFVSLVSHELRSPMAAVIGAARTLEQRWRELTPEQRDAFLSLISDETDRLAALVGDVLDTSRIDSGAFSYTFANVDVGELVREIAAVAAAGRDGITVTAAVRGSLPPVRGDRERLRQVFLNLIDNAVRYSREGDEVRVAAFATDGGVQVDVVDTGPGIASEQQELIFEKFGRAPSPSGGKPGTGLGLFIARAIVEAHGGRLEVSSRPGSGSTFSVVLPAAGPS